MKLAIVLWYTEYQNEPSEPNKQLINLPDSVVERDKMLIAQFVEEHGDEDVKPDDLTVRGDEDVDDLTVESENGVYYGDLQVSYGETHMFVTFAELPEKSA